MKQYRRLNAYSGFTLVELMVAVSLLAIGIVLIVRGLVFNASALGTAENKIKALQFLTSKMAVLEEKSHEEGGLKPGQTQEQVLFDGRKATFVQAITPLEIEGLKDELNEAMLVLSWKEGGVSKDAILAGYFDNKK